MYLPEDALLPSRPVGLTCLPLCNLDYCHDHSAFYPRILILIRLLLASTASRESGDKMLVLHKEFAEA